MARGSTSFGFHVLCLGIIVIEMATKMRLIGLMPVRNEDWVLGLSARVALLWCDALVVLDHASIDGTALILAQLQGEYGDRLKVLHEPNPAWREMAHRQRLLEAARAEMATHIAIIDADEVLTDNLVTDIRHWVEQIPFDSILELPGYNLRGGLGRYHVNGIWGQRWFSTTFANDWRLSWDGDRFHHREPMGVDLRVWRPVRQGYGGVIHLWGASERRLRAKHALYKMVEALHWPNKPVADIERMYNLAFVPSANPMFDQNWEYAALPANWWHGYQQWMAQVNVDRTPWQEEACRRLLAEHGEERFAGLDLFGICPEEMACIHRLAV